VGTSNSSDSKSTSIPKIQYIIIVFTLYASPDTPDLLTSKFFNRVVAAHMNCKEPLLIVSSDPSTHNTTIKLFLLFELIE
jgi:hypothetical protein